ncbi:Ankyrin repeat protein 1 [Giardia muris]|uniref:Ankyrin repeat protein 1 n=1 Tax=Giardia muris TaxID=5742 RepID=A0A4Z1SMP1_GIAMU|nr:Ankyrin repeat protein 1 [Giardia muris]|eukprot:TNJ26954.1 Ankyrin repeat protein 1 [Giardia muris]
MSGNALLTAAQRGNISEVYGNLNLVKTRDENGMTALMLAARNGHKTCVEALVQYEKGLIASSGRTALMYAADAGHANCVQLLAQHEGRMQDFAGLTALMFAAFQNQVECVSLLLEASEAGMCTRRPYGRLIPAGSTALMIAAFQGHNDVVKLLKKHEARSRDSRGHDSAWYARYQAVCPHSFEIMESGHQETVAIVREGASESNPEFAMTPPPFPESKPPVSSVSHIGNVSESSVQLKSFQDECTTPGADHDSQITSALHQNSGSSTSERLTELMHAAEVNDLEAARKHLDQAGRTTWIGWTALMIAVKHGSLDVARLLVERESGRRTNNGETALMQAAIYGRTELVESLVDAEGNMTDNKGWTALMHATFYGREESIDVLISMESGKQSSESFEESVKLNPRRFASRVSALMIAAAKSVIPAIEALKDYEDGLVDGDGHDALWYAKTYGTSEAIHALTTTDA